MCPKDNQLAITMRQLRVMELDASGMMDKDIARTLGVARSTVGLDLKYVRELMGADPDIQAARRQQSLLRGLANRSLIRNLAKSNPAITIAFQKGIGVWQDHVKDDSVPPIDPNELANLIEQALGNKDGKSGVVSSTDEGDAGPSSP